MPENIFSLNTTLVVLVVTVAAVLAANVVAVLMNAVLRIIIKVKGL